MKQLPSLEQLNELFTYNKETGVLIRKGDTKHCQDKFTKASTKDYTRKRVNGVLYQAHRICYYMGTGVEPNHIDHINGVRTDNRLCNLRSVNHTDNMRNLPRPINNSSGVTGVRFKGSKWEARLGQAHLGSFTDKIDAIYARHYAQADANYHTNHGRV